MYAAMDFVDAMPLAEFVGLLSIIFATAFFVVHVLYFLFLYITGGIK